MKPSDANTKRCKGLVAWGFGVGKVDRRIPKDNP